MVADYCILCKSKKQDNARYGEFIIQNGVGVHTFCLYLTSNLVQNGADYEGFYGFLLSDILKEVKRISKLQCCYCRKNYAGIGCCNASCSRSFHLICGIENGALNQFTKAFLSFCHQHSSSAVVLKPPPSSKELCCICYNALVTPKDKLLQHNVNIILSPCCQNGWFHKVCLQEFALNAGYFFKCPLCNDMKTFREELPFYGVFIFDRDAAWELEPNAFADLLERPTTCSAEICYNKQGRSRTTKDNCLIFCETCGSQAVHKKCWLHIDENQKEQKQQQSSQEYNCMECLGTLEKLNLSSHTGNEVKQSLVEDCDNENDQPVIDVCYISDNSSDENVKLAKTISLQSFTRNFRNRLISSSDSNARRSIDNSDKVVEPPASTDDGDDDDKPLRYKSSRKIKKSVLYVESSGDENSINNKDPKDIDDRKSIIQVHIRSDSTLCPNQDDNMPLSEFRDNINRRNMMSNKNENQMEFNSDKPTTSQNGYPKDKMYHTFGGDHDSDFDSDSNSDIKPLSMLLKEQQKERNLQEESSTNQSSTTQRNQKRKLPPDTRDSDIPSPFRVHYSKRLRNNYDNELQDVRRTRRRRKRTCRKSSQTTVTLQNSSDEEMFCINKNIETSRRNKPFETRNRRVPSVSSNCEKEQKRTNRTTTSTSCTDLRRTRRSFRLHSNDISSEQKEKEANNLKISRENLKTPTQKRSSISINVDEESKVNAILPRNRSSTSLPTRRRRHLSSMSMNTNAENEDITPCIALRTRRRNKFLCNQKRSSIHNDENKSNAISPNRTSCIAHRTRRSCNQKHSSTSMNVNEENGILTRSRSCEALRTRRRNQRYSKEEMPKPKMEYSSGKEETASICHLPSYGNKESNQVKGRKRRKRRGRSFSSRRNNSQVPKDVQNKDVNRNYRKSTSNITRKRGRPRLSNKNRDTSENSTRISPLISSTFRSETRTNLMENTNDGKCRTLLSSLSAESICSLLSSSSQGSSYKFRKKKAL